MKRGLLFVTILLWCGLLLCACNKKVDKEVNEIDQEEVVYDYDLSDVSAFCVDQEGILYTRSVDNNRMQVVDKEGKVIKEYTDMFEAFFGVYDKSLYYLSFFTLNELDLITGESRLLCEIDSKGTNYQQYNGLVAFKNYVFFIQKGIHDEKQAAVRYDENDTYVYEGEILHCYDIEKEELTAIAIPNIKLIAKKNDTELLIYAYDDIGGYYFSTYDLNKGEMTDKIYTEMKVDYILCMAYDDELDRIVCSGSDGLFAFDMKEPEAQAFFYEKSRTNFSGNGLYYLDGYTYCIYYWDNACKISKVYNKALIKDNPVLKCYSVTNFYLPKELGYKIDYCKVGWSELATALMAGDSNYDFAILSSGYEEAKSIRNLGAYEPLNAVDGVDGLLEQCFDYIKEAATINGDIWMLPIGVECPVLVYNSEVFRSFGIDIKTINTYEKFFDVILTFSKDSSLDYGAGITYMTSDIVNKYLAYYAIEDNKAHFKTELFEKYANIMYKNIEYSNSGSIYTRYVSDHYDPIKANGIGMEEYKDFYYTKVAFDMMRSMSWLYNYYPYEYLKAIAMPGLEEDKELKSIAECYFIILNPSSKNLDLMKEYLTEVCEVLKGDTNSFMRKDLDFSDIPLRQQVQEIYAQGEVYFQEPYEIVGDELSAYYYEGKSLDEAVAEMERKMNMYLRE